MVVVYVACEKKSLNPFGPVKISRSNELQNALIVLMEDRGHQHGVRRHQVVTKDHEWLAGLNLAKSSES